MGIKTSHLGFVWEREHSTYIMSHHGFSFLSKVGTTHSTPRALTPLLLWASLCSQQPFRVYLGEGGLRIRHLQNQPFRVLGGDSTYIMISAFFQSLERLIPLQGLLLISCFGHPYAHSIRQAEADRTEKDSKRGPSTTESEEGNPGKQHGKTRQRTEERSKPTPKTHKEAGQQKPELPPPSR